MNIIKKYREYKFAKVQLNFAEDELNKAKMQITSFIDIQLLKSRQEKQNKLPACFNMVSIDFERPLIAKKCDAFDDKHNICIGCHMSGKRDVYYDAKDKYETAKQRMNVATKNLKIELQKIFPLGR